MLLLLLLLTKDNEKNGSWVKKTKRSQPTLIPSIAHLAYNSGPRRATPRLSKLFPTV